MNNGRILVVDKDRFYRELYHDLLSGVGYEVYTFDSYDAANTDMAKFDLVICEPNTDKNSVGTMVGQIKKLRYMPEVLVVTSQNTMAVKSFIPDNELNYTYIKKPFDDSRFLHIVTNIIAQRRLFMEKEKLAKEGMEYLILLEVYKRASDILSQGSVENVLKKMMDAVIVELKLSRAMLWFRGGDDDFNLSQSFGYESQSYDEATTLSWKSFPYRTSFKDGYYLLSDNRNKKVLYLAVQGQDGNIYALLRLLKKDGSFSIQDVRIARTLSTFSGIAISNAVKLSQKFVDTLRAENLPAYSYRYFTEYTENEIRRAHRIRGMFSIAVVSVENYRELVETFGKSYVNEVFVKITNFINEVIRDADTLAVSESPNRLNIFLPDTDYFGSIITMRRIKNKLRQTLYITDGSVTRNVDLIIGSSTYPADGTTAETLLTSSYEMARRSRSGRLKEITAMESMGFMEFSDQILKIFRHPDQKDDVNNAVLGLTEERIAGIINLMADDMLARPFMRGLMFLGLPSVTKETKLIKEQYKLYNSNTKFYLLGKKAAGEYMDIAYAPIIIINENIGNRYFLFNLNEEYAYGLITDEPSGQEFSVFHTSDPIIVEEMIAVLQERYFLQRQI